jgi:hypothetical protein
MNTTFSKDEQAKMLLEFSRLHPPETFGSMHRFWDAWSEYITTQKDLRWPRCLRCGLRRCECRAQGQVA